SQMLAGDFEAEAETRRSAHRALAEDARRALVELAIPLNGPDDQLPIHAVLPTHQKTPLKFRLSSSFYPYQNRKRIKLEDEQDAESTWNRTAIRRAAEALAQNVVAVRDALGARRFWEL